MTDTKTLGPWTFTPAYRTTFAPWSVFQNYALDDQTIATQCAPGRTIYVQGIVNRGSEFVRLTIWHKATRQ